MKIFSTDFKRALCVLLLAPLGWLAGYHSVHAATAPNIPEWRSIGDKIQFYITGTNWDSQLVPYCCEEFSPVAGCVPLGNTPIDGTSTSTAPTTSWNTNLINVSKEEVVAKCVSPQSRRFLFMSWFNGSTKASYTTGAQTWPAAPSAYNSNVYVQFFLWTSPVWLILLFLWLAKRR